MTRARKWLLGFVVFVLLLVVAGVIAAKTGRTWKSDEDKLRDRLQSNESMIEATPSSILNDYRTSEIRGDGNWRGRLVRLTATVDGIRRNSERIPVAVVHTFHADVDPDRVFCLLDGDYDLPIGPKVVLRCVVVGLQQGVPTLDLCRPE